jgi:dTDP-4-dehydrorhamnose reductase
LAHAARALAGSGKFDHPVLAKPGWWGRDDRFYGIGPQAPAISRGTAPAIALVGAPAGFGIECLRIAHHRGLELDLVRDAPDPRWSAGSRPAPWAIVDASGLEPAPAARNEGLLSWLNAAEHSGLRCCFLSRSDVFDARSGRAAVEDDLPSPVSDAGRRRAAQEEAFLAHHPGALVIRAGRLFGPGADHPTNTMEQVSPAQDGDNGAVAGRFSYVPDFIHAAFDLLLDQEKGFRHLVNGEPLGSSIPRRGAPTLATTRGLIMPSLESARAREADCAQRIWDRALQAAE